MPNHEPDIDPGRLADAIDLDGNGPGWCDLCSPDPCDCDDGPDDLSDLGPLDDDAWDTAESD